MEFIYEPEFWVAVSFFLFVGGVLYLGVHKKINSALDSRASKIEAELGEAARLTMACASLTASPCLRR